MEELTYILVYLSFIIFATIPSLICLRPGLPPHLRIFAVLICMSFIVELYCSNVFQLFKSNNNNAVYNCFSLIEFWLYGFYYYRLIHIASLRKLIYSYLVIFPIFWVITVFGIFGFNVWNSYVITAGSFFCILFVLMFYYQLIVSPRIIPLRRLPEFWIATGMLIFYIGALPFFGTLNFFSQNRSIAMSLWHVLVLLDSAMYGFFTYAFICQIINTKKSLSL